MTQVTSLSSPGAQPLVAPRLASKSRFVTPVSQLVAACPYPLRLWEGRDTHPTKRSRCPHRLHLVLQLQGSTKVPNPSLMNPSAVINRTKNLPKANFSPRLALLDPLDQTGEEYNLRLIDLPISNFAWLFALATKKGPSRLLVQTTSS